MVHSKNSGDRRGPLVIVIVLAVFMVVMKFHQAGGELFPCGDQPSGAVYT